jgi:hypothetical protein
MRMKKIIVCLLACLNLSACVNAGDFDLLPIRRKILNLYKGHTIEFYDNEEELVGKERIHENDYQLNKAVTVKKGEDVLSDTLMDKRTYQRFFIKFNKKGSLDNRIYPMNVNADDEYKIVGWVTIDNNKYSLVASPLDDYVFLFDEQGNLYERGGKIVDDRLQLLEDTVFAYPADLKIKLVNKMRDSVSNVKKGYQVKYGGIKFDRLFFDYLGFDADNDTRGEFKQINFPNKPGLIVINGIGLRVLNADDSSITYMILQDNL